ncbi:hypothetical protein QVD17_17415 [Tagetes erecta]|uniref:Uncharacterized protein n=1 Tax=Tagetes erecta TaxID=13708 RepID=A0AAD8KYC0_TARER|nr:hypothetical protein QVD17_17415 [Tagetes erecta]
MITSSIIPTTQKAQVLSRIYSRSAHLYSNIGQHTHFIHAHHASSSPNITNAQIGPSSIPPATFVLQLLKQ